MNDTEFFELSDQAFQKIEDAIEKTGADIDYDQNGNVLTLECENRTQLIINRQLPLHQIWLATVDNGSHYSYVEGNWIDDRNGNEFFDFLSKAILKQSNEKLIF